MPGVRHCSTAQMSRWPVHNNLSHWVPHAKLSLQDGRSPSSTLKTGLSAPTYRPSVLPMRVGTGGGSRARGKLAPSAPAAVAAALHHLVTDRRTLEVQRLSHTYTASLCLVYLHVLQSWLLQQGLRLVI
jgi:hypothetical protein